MNMFNLKLIMHYQLSN